MAGTRALFEGWTLKATAAGTIPGPSALDGSDWLPALVPGTVAQSLDLPLDSTRDLDVEDWWYRCTFDAAEPAARLRFEGLATLAEVWLNGARILQARNMFRAYTCEVEGLRPEGNELLICFRALASELAARRPRPRWKTALVAHQNLRFVRTSLLGRIPAWMPKLAPVGPWRAITLEPASPLSMRELDLQTWAEDGRARLRLRALLPSGASAAAVRVGSHRAAVGLSPSEEGLRLEADLDLEELPLWWPHTHGEPALHACALEVATPDGPVSLDLGPVGFRALRMDRTAGRVQLEVNGRPVFCRGACWTTLDPRGLDGSPARLREALMRAREAGFNLLRVGGTMAYESEGFYRLCDELGLMVWQDFMFANMDYPVGDEAFRAELRAEALHQLSRLQRHACVAVYCGGSEVEQQAAMLGLPPSEWSDDWFAEELPTLCASCHPGVPYFPSTPCEGALPFHVATGITHYYGVGAYLRPLAELKHAGVKFTPETLGFSQVPEDATLELLGDGAIPPPHHPAWKARVPRDSGAGWDFEDVRDHYVRELFRIDPVALRSFDPLRYRAISRLVTGEVMRAAFAEWRRADNPCAGALVWFFQDLWPGAGWGLLDSELRPKAAWWFLRRALAPRALLLTDEGLDGARIHVHNETAEPLAARVELELLQSGRTRIAQGSLEVEVPAFSAASLEGDALLGHFTDSAYAYRFGPPKHDVVLARLVDATGGVLSEDALFPSGLDLPRLEDPKVEARALAQKDGSILVNLESEAFLQDVTFAAKGYRPGDCHFHLAPGRRREIRFLPEPGAGPFKAHVEALNWRGSLTVRPEEG